MNDGCSCWRQTHAQRLNDYECAWSLFNLPAITSRADRSISMLWQWSQPISCNQKMYILWSNWKQKRTSERWHLHLYFFNSTTAVFFMVRALFLFSILCIDACVIILLRPKCKFLLLYCTLKHDKPANKSFTWPRHILSFWFYWWSYRSYFRHGWVFYWVWLNKSKAIEPPADVDLSQWSRVSIYWTENPSIMPREQESEEIKSLRVFLPSIFYPLHLIQCNFLCFTLCARVYISARPNNWFNLDYFSVTQIPVWSKSDVRVDGGIKYASLHAIEGFSFPVIWSGRKWRKQNPL